MDNLAYRIDAAYETVAAQSEPTHHDYGGTCAACGEKLFGDDAPEVLWQVWSAFWGISGANHVDLVCGACGEYLQQIFND